jgi:uncharacterized protein YuzE
MSEHYEYDRESDVLDVYFGEKRAAWTIELTEHIMLSLDRKTGQVVSLSLLDFSELIRPTPLGLRSFPLTGLADLPQVERERVAQALTTPPVNHWLDVSVVQTMPDSPFIVTHVEPSRAQTMNVVPAAA